MTSAAESKSYPSPRPGAAVLREVGHTVYLAQYCAAGSRTSRLPRPVLGCWKWDIPFTSPLGCGARARAAPSPTQPVDHPPPPFLSFLIGVDEVAPAPDPAMAAGRRGRGAARAAAALGAIWAAAAAVAPAPAPSSSGAAPVTGAGAAADAVGLEALLSLATCPGRFATVGLTELGRCTRGELQKKGVYEVKILID